MGLMRLHFNLSHLRNISGQSLIHNGRRHGWEIGGQALKRANHAFEINLPIDVEDGILRHIPAASVAQGVGRAIGV